VRTNKKGERTPSPAPMTQKGMSRQLHCGVSGIEAISRPPIIYVAKKLNMVKNLKK
jgi:hypothetical protein